MRRTLRGAVPRPRPCRATARGAGIRAALDRRRIEAARAHLFQHALAILGRQALQALGEAASAASAAAAPPRRPLPVEPPSSGRSRSRARSAEPRHDPKPAAPALSADCPARSRAVARVRLRGTAGRMLGAGDARGARGPEAARSSAGSGGVWPSAAKISLVGRNRSRRIRDPQHVGALGDLDVDVGRHAGLQLQRGVGDVDDRRVGDDVLLHDRLQPHLRHRAVEVVGRVGVDAERHVLAGTDAADVRLVEVGDDLHLREIGREDEQGRRRHAGGHRLADVHIARDDQPVDRRADDRVLQVDLVLVERRARLRDLRLRGADLRVDRSDVDLGGLQLALRNQLPARQLLRAGELRAGVLETDLEAIEIGLRANQVRARLFDLGLEEGRVQSSEDLALLDQRVEIGIQGLQACPRPACRPAPS